MVKTKSATPSKDSAREMPPGGGRLSGGGTATFLQLIHLFSQLQPAALQIEVGLFQARFRHNARAPRALGGELPVKFRLGFPVHMSSSDPLAWPRCPVPTNKRT